MTVLYLLGFISLPNKMLLRMVPGNTQGCWAAYVTRPLTWSVPESWGSSPRTALNRDDCGNSDAVETRATLNYFNRSLHLLQPEANHGCVLTFPAPTGPMTARSCCGPTEREMFLRLGASIHWFGTKNNHTTKPISSAPSSVAESIPSCQASHLVPEASYILKLNEIFQSVGFLQGAPCVSALNFS